MTARELITSSLRLIGVAAQGEPVSAADAAAALDVLNDLVDAWSAERLTLYAQTRTVAPLVVGDGEYTIGASGNINIPRPFWIDAASFLLADGVETPIRMYTRQEWARKSLKDLESSIPHGIFYNPTFPLGTVSVWPVPTDNTISIVLYTPTDALASVASLDTVISMPKGWRKALRSNLAVDLGIEFGKPADGQIIGMAQASKATIKNTQQDETELEIDPALRGGGGGWDYHTGEYQR